jgi:hypothetical protein
MNYTLDADNLTVIAIDKHGEMRDLNAEGEPCTTPQELSDFIDELLDQGVITADVHTDLGVDLQASIWSATGDTLVLRSMMGNPAWVKAAGTGHTGAWWPCGQLEHTRKDGSELSGVLVVRITDHVSLQVVRPQTRVVMLRQDDLVLGDAELKRAIAIATAIVQGAELTIGYVKKGEPEPVARRLGDVVPHPKGSLIVATDLDKDAPRSFRLDRIAWVRVESEVNRG